MRNRKSKEKYKPADGSFCSTAGGSGSSPDLNSEIENLFNTYTYQNNVAVDCSGNPLHDTELASDVTFLAGIEPEVWRIPGHRRLLADKNGVFEAMFFGALARNRTEDRGVINITDVTGRAFDYFIKFLYNDEVEFQTVPSALEILHVANKYLCTQLIKKCVFYLDQHMSTDNVLEIYSNVQIYTATHDMAQSVSSLHHLVPTAPMLEDVFELSQHVSGERRASLRENTAENRIKAQYKYILDLMQPGNDSPETINRILNMLCYNCLLFIDSHAHQIFSCLQNVENISNINTLYTIFSRGTLQVQDELILYKFLNAYLTNTLKQLQIPISFTNKRQFLTNQSCDRVLFTIKYLKVEKFNKFLNYVHENEKNNLFHSYELDFLGYLRENASHLYMIVQNLSNMPQSNNNFNDDNSRNRSKFSEDRRTRTESPRVHSWESYNVDHIDVLFLNESRSVSTEIFLPLSLRSLPKMKPETEAQAQEKIATCKSKDKRKFAEYVWTVLAFIFD